MNSKQKFANNLNILMDLDRKSEDEICNKLEINHNTFTDWINGYTIPSMDVIEKLADCFMVRSNYLLEEIPESYINMVKFNRYFSDLYIVMRKDKFLYTEAPKLLNADNKTLTNILKMLENKDWIRIMDILSQLNEAQVESVKNYSQNF